ncbi:MAG TPA: DUF4238 domain-containing protein [Chthoniobacterales bacterium]|jgi:hypothetical protein
MKAATRAHTVPRFYLRGFVAPESEEAINIEPYLWLAEQGTNEVKRRSPKNVSTESGYYDGPGGFDSPAASIERHLASIENDAATAIARFAESQIATGATVVPEIWRFLCWQAVRTPGWFELVEDWVYRSTPGDSLGVIESPPEGIEKIKERSRPICMENPDSGERYEVTSAEDFNSYRDRGWKWVIRTQDRLEMLHMQAWYLQVRHFPRLSWSRLNAPGSDWFVTSDRAVTWIVDGYADAPPAALRHLSAVVMAPLTRKVALVGRHGAQPVNVTPRQVNQFVAASASRWVAGPSREVVDQAMKDRAVAHTHST